MKKYAVILQIAGKRALVYRGIGLIYLLLSLINITLSILIWNVIYRNPSFQAEESFSLIISYFLAVLFFNQLVNSYVAGEVADEYIKRGELSVFLLKPFPFFLYEMLVEIPWRLLAFLMSFPAIAVFVLLYHNQINFSLPLIFIALLLIGFCYLLSFLVQMSFALLTFWFEDTHGIFSLIEVVTILFSGVGIPVFFFPPILKAISAVLPFQYMLYFPVALSLNRLSSLMTIQFFEMLLFWIIMLGFINWFLWKRGLKKFSGEGR